MSSAGRRVYLVQWFRQALRDSNIDGDVFVLDSDPRAASAGIADGYRELPLVSNPEYPTALMRVVGELKPDLLLSLNDHELTALASGLGDELRANGVVLPLLDAQHYDLVHDKLAMATTLLDAGIATPQTVSQLDTSGITALLDTAEQVVLKDRWGSGSLGLRTMTRVQTHEWLSQHATAELCEDCFSGVRELIFQPALEGVEFGLDIVVPIEGGPVQAVLARQKLGMRHGETSVAVTVESSPFQQLAQLLNAVLNFRGTNDVDVIQTPDGALHVIDINPRFGGGYPFSHMAGADVPHYLVHSALGLTPRADWADYQVGLTSAKHEEIITLPHTLKTPSPPFTG